MKSCADCLCMVRNRRNFCRYWERSHLLTQYGPYPRWKELRWGHSANAKALQESEFGIAEDCKLFERKGGE